MNRMEWERFCDWQYEINQPLECFLNDPQPFAWGHPVQWIALAIFIGIGALLEWKGKNK